MQNIIFATFGNYKYYNALERIKKEAESFNIFNKILIYNDIDLFNYPKFWKKHSEFIINNPRGYGYWIWKSFLIGETLKIMNENDILIYCDAGCSLNNNGIKRLYEYIDILNDSEHSILSFELDLYEKQYTKMDLFEYMDMNNETDVNNKQLIATVFILKKNKNSTKLVNEWYNIMSHNYNLIDDSPSNLINDDSFVENRHDQSVFSLLRKKYGTCILKDETFFDDFNSEKAKQYPFLAKRSNN
jgi:hypothetical protein